MSHLLSIGGSRFCASFGKESESIPPIEPSYKTERDKHKMYFTFLFDLNQRGLLIHGRPGHDRQQQQRDEWVGEWIGGWIDGWIGGQVNG